VLELDAVSVSFGGITAIDGVSLRADAGEILGLIGPNGAGKTTLFDVISGVRAPDAGRVVLDGTDISRRTSAARARLGLRRTFQRVQTFGWLTVEENVLTALEWRGGGGGLVADLVWSPSRRRRERERRRSAAETLERCGLSDLKGELAASLPIGIGRMVELARAIVDRPRLLLLDEPASGLDENEAQRLSGVIQDVRTETDCAVMLVEHDATFVMANCDRIVVLDLGSILAEGLPEEIQGSHAVRSAYLGAAANDEVGGEPCRSS